MYRLPKIWYVETELNFDKNCNIYFIILERIILYDNLVQKAVYIKQEYGNIPMNNKFLTLHSSKK